MDENESTKDDVHMNLLGKSSQHEEKSIQKLEIRLQEIRVTVEELRRIQKDPVDEYYTIRKLWEICHDKTFRNHRKEIGDTLSECCYSSCTYKMMKRLMTDGYYPQTCWAWLTNWSLWKVTTFVFDIADTFSYHSEELSKDFLKDNVLELMIRNLDLFQDITPAHGSYHHYIILSTLSIIKNIACSIRSKKEFQKYDLVTHLLRLRTSMDEELRVLALSAQAFITEVKDSHQLVDDHDTIRIIIEWMEEAIENEEEGRENEDGHRDVCKLANVVNKLAIERNARKITDAGGLAVLGKMLNSTDVNKRVVASNCLCTLAFHDVMREPIKEDGELMKTLKTLEKIETRQDLLKDVKGTLWLIQD